jgi:hypothetical protein
VRPPAPPASRPRCRGAAARRTARRAHRGPGPRAGPRPGPAAHRARRASAAATCGRSTASTSARAPRPTRASWPATSPRGRSSRPGRPGALRARRPGRGLPHRGLRALPRVPLGLHGRVLGCEPAAHGWQRDGGHAPYMLAEERTLVPLPAPLTFADGRVRVVRLRHAYEAVRRLGVSGRDRVLVTGPGARRPRRRPPGQAARRPRDRRLGPRPPRRELAGRVGRWTGARPGDCGRPVGADVSVDCSGAASPARPALEACAASGAALRGRGRRVTIDVIRQLIHKDSRSSVG